MDCPRCGAPLSARDIECRFCGRGRDALPKGLENAVHTCSSLASSFVHLLHAKT